MQGCLIRRVSRDIYAYTIEKHGKVNGDALYYRKWQELLEEKWGKSEDVLPNHGRIQGRDRRWEDVLRTRFANGRRSNAVHVYRQVVVNRINLCAEGEALIANGLFADAQVQAEPETTEEATEQAAQPDVIYKRYNPARDARTAFRNVYTEDPVLGLIMEVRASAPAAPAMLARSCRACLLVPRCEQRDDDGAHRTPRLPRVPMLTRFSAAPARSQDVPDRKAAIKVGAWLLLPAGAWFDYMDSTAMPRYVTAKVVKKVAPRDSDKPAFQVKMIGDGTPEITVKYYLEAHPAPGDWNAGEEHKHLTHENVKILSAEPPIVAA